MRIIALVISIVFLVSGSAASRAPQQTGDCGRAVDGVQICLATSSKHLTLVFANIGDRDVMLNLGIMLANGNVQLPTHVAVKFADAQGKTRLFKFSDKKFSAVLGRVDDYVLPLRAGSQYTIQLTLDQFWCPETSEFSIPLLAGDNYLTAQFDGTEARALNLDTPGIKLMKFWLGKVESNRLRLSR